MSGDRTFLHCGLVVRSEIDLHLPSADGEHDLDVRCGPDLTADSSAMPEGEVVAEFWEHDRRLYTATRHAAGYTVRFPGCGEFSISPDLSTVDIHPAADGQYVDLLPVLMAGTVVSMIHGLRGSTLLHASAVEIDGKALAFVGRSGQGKSTLAALLCASGASLVTDDVLLVRADPEPTCIGAASEIRLRPSGEWVVAELPGAHTRATPDERVAMTPRRVTVGELPLAAVVVPVPTRETTSVNVAELQSAQALMALLAFPRIAGWQDPGVLGRQFDDCGRLAESVAVFSAMVPWESSFDGAVICALSSLVT